MRERPTAHQIRQLGSSRWQPGAVRGPAGADQPVRGERELVVFWVRQRTQCGECDAELDRGSLLRVEGEHALCLACADLDHLEYLPCGDAALTRRAHRASVLQAVVVEWSRTRQRYGLCCR